jgi:hypothetical protein
MRYALLPAVAGAFISLTAGALAQSRNYDLPDFDSVSVSAGVTAIIAVGGTQSVTAESSSAAALNRLEVDVRDRRLEIGIESNPLGLLFNFGRSDRIVVRISAPHVSKAEASSGANVDVDGMSGDSLALFASSGAALAATGLSGAAVTIDGTVGANLDVSGTCGRLSASASSGASVEAGDLVCGEVRAQASSGAHLTVYAQTAIDADASVGGGVTVRGKPADMKVTSSTGGAVSFVP